MRALLSCRLIEVHGFTWIRAEGNRPTHEAGNYVPTMMGARYDALLWFEETSALRRLHHEGRPREPELETEPAGF